MSDKGRICRREGCAGRRGLVRGATAAGLLLAAACGPLSEQEREYFRRQQADRWQHEILEGLKRNEMLEEQALLLVKQAPAPAGEGTTAEWVQTLEEREKGRIRFARWDVIRQPENKAIVRYRYTVTGSNLTVTKKAVEWTVDVGLRQVSEARFLPDAGAVETSSGMRPRERRAHRRRARWGEESLK